MPGIDDVDRQFRRRIPTAPTDGELAAERAAQAAQGGMPSEAERGVREDCAAAAAAIGNEVEEVPLPRDPHWPLPSFDAVDWGREFCRIMRERVQTAPDEDWVIGWFANALMRGHDEGVKRATAMAFEEQRSAEDRREVRRQALICAVEAVQHVAPRPLLIEEVLKTAAAFARYLLGEGDDPSVPKPPAKME